MTPDVNAALNGTNAIMVNKITGRDIRDETTDGKSFDLVKWIRVRKLQWLGHILGTDTERKIKQSVYIMYKNPRQGDMLMDTPKTRTYVCDREYWKSEVTDPSTETAQGDNGDIRSTSRSGHNSPFHGVNMTC